jgi:hypothetical protein
MVQWTHASRRRWPVWCLLHLVMFACGLDVLTAAAVHTLSAARLFSRPTCRPTTYSKINVQNSAESVITTVVAERKCTQNCACLSWHSTVKQCAAWSTAPVLLIWACMHNQQGPPDGRGACSASKGHLMGCSQTASLSPDFHAALGTLMS